MAIQGMATQAARVGVWKGEILARAIPVEVLGLAGTIKSIPKNASDTVKYRRWVPYNAANTVPSTGVVGYNGLVPDRVTAETEAGTNVVKTMLAAHETADAGATPSAETIVAQDITATLVQYACLYSFTDKVVDLYEDDVSDALKTQVAERMALIRELELYSKVRAGTNRQFAGGSTIGTVAAKITPSFLRKAARSLAKAHSKKITSILAPSANIGTKPIEAAYLVFCHSDIEADLRDETVFPTYTPVAAYGSRKPMHENEIGSFESFRFIVSPELVPFTNAGVAVGVTGFIASGATLVDVYPVLIVGQEAYGTVALRGSNSFDLSVIPVGNKDSADPLGQRGYIGAKFYACSVMLNQGWSVTGFVASGALA